MNTLTSDMHQASEYGELFAAIEKRMKENLGASTTTPAEGSKQADVTGLAVGSTKVLQTTGTS